MSKKSVTPSAVSRFAHGGQIENRWRYVWHNDRWWYWTAAGHWSVFDGRQWINYDPQRTLPGALAAGYRKSPAFEKPPTAPPRPPRSWPAEGVEREVDLIDLFDLGGQGEGAAMHFGGSSLPSVNKPSAPTGNISLPGGTGGVGSASGAAKGGSRTGSGAFGGPTGGSLGAGSAAGGASSPQ